MATKNGNILELPIEKVLGERFAIYSKYIIQERALPDVRDGLKPVQRRILYAMYKDKNTFEKGYRKSVKTVGNVIGNYHPHGDSSVYEAMIRLSQDWKLRSPLIDIHGNNGSIDGDPPAAMRYTEARLSKLSTEMLKDIDKETVDYIPNFDDTEEEPTVLPSRFPNLLVNGSSGISAGYATEIPSHNLGEVIDAVAFRLKFSNCNLDDIMFFIKGPDFPTGGIIQGTDQIKKAYEKGKGRIIMRCKYDIKLSRTGVPQAIVITEIPYDVNKSTLMKKMEDIRINKKVHGISDIRDESGKDGLKIVVDLKKDANQELIVNYLLKNTDLQKSYNFNMVVINEKKPQLMGLLPILDAYIEHQKIIITKRSQFEHKKASNRLHILEGLVKMVSILDDVIKTIRASKDKKDAKEKIIEKFNFTERQAEAIVTLQLYRLSNTDVFALENEARELTDYIKVLDEILSSDDKLTEVLIDELNEIKEEYATDRKTELQKEIKEVVIKKEDLIKSEQVLVSVTRDGYIKASMVKDDYSYNDFGKKPEDIIIASTEINTLNQLLIFTSLGNYIILPGYNVAKYRWNQIGDHLSKYVKLGNGEKVVNVIPIDSFDNPNTITMFTRQGNVKRTLISDFKVSRNNKSFKCIKLKDDDALVSVQITADEGELIMITRNGLTNRFEITDVPVAGIKGAGVRGIKLKDDDVCVSGINNNCPKGKIVLITTRGNIKKVKPTDIKKTSRATVGVQIIKILRTNPHFIVNAMLMTNDEVIMASTSENEVLLFEHIENVRPMDLHSTGSKIFELEKSVGIDYATKIITCDQLLGLKSNENNVE